MVRSEGHDWILGLRPVVLGSEGHDWVLGLRMVVVGSEGHDWILGLRPVVLGSEGHDWILGLRPVVLGSEGHDWILGLRLLVVQPATPAAIILTSGFSLRRHFPESADGNKADRHHCRVISCLKVSSLKRRRRQCSRSRRRTQTLPKCCIIMVMFIITARHPVHLPTSLHTSFPRPSHS